MEVPSYKGLRIRATQQIGENTVSENTRVT